MLASAPAGDLVIGQLLKAGELADLVGDLLGGVAIAFGLPGRTRRGAGRVDDPVLQGLADGLGALDLLLRLTALAAWSSSCCRRPGFIRATSARGSL